MQSTPQSHHRVDVPEISAAYKTPNLGG